MARRFEDTTAVRENTPVMVGLVGPSGCGKTYSALRLATGIQRVTGGEIFVIDTEARRSLHYAEKFKFRHVAFGAPFSPLDYLGAIEHCVSKGAKTIVVDSMSHEHEGPGGVLEMHSAAVDRMSKGDSGKAERVKMLAWAKPKAERRRLINTLLQLPCNFLLCFRAKEKLKIERGKEPVPLGFMPIGGDEFIYEMTINALLLPGARGVPSWHSNEIGERAMIKLPEQFESLFPGDVQLSEDIGEKLARWAAGTVTVAQVPASDLLARYEACSDPATWRALEDTRKAVWSSASAGDKRRLKEASDAAQDRILRAEADDAQPDDAPDDGSDEEGQR